jgi:hypothetical protein
MSRMFLNLTKNKNHKMINIINNKIKLNNLKNIKLNTIKILMSLMLGTNNFKIKLKSLMMQ